MGGFTLDNGIQVIEADGVTIENMTARHYLVNGFLWSSVFGYRGSYLTAFNDGDYGLFAFDSRVRAVRPLVRERAPRLGLLHRPVLPRVTP